MITLDIISLSLITAAHLLSDHRITTADLILSLATLFTTLFVVDTREFLLGTPHVATFNGAMKSMDKLLVRHAAHLSHCQLRA